MISDDLYLTQTFKLAKKGMGRTNPNPMVGAILVKNGKVIGQGYHKKAGDPHAEIEAIMHARPGLAKLEGATLYFNLEPCIHFGKTPPCVNKIIQSGIKRVVCCTLDPNPKVFGQGIALLKKAGVKVSVGKMSDQARLLNEVFFTFHEKKRPFISVKFAASLDGKIATYTGSSKWITNEKARKYARKLRSQYQAILVGINTIIKDNPRLTAQKEAKDPLRIILDSTLKIPLNSKVLKDSNVLIATTIWANTDKKKLLEQRGISLLIFKEKHVPIRKLLKRLWEREIISILVEGGEKILGSFLDERCIEKVYAFYAPILIGGEGAINAIGGEGVETINRALHLKNITYQKFGDNFLVTGYTT